MRIETPGGDMRLPDFMIIGAAKSGTTSLYHYLGQHPGLYFPRDFKEPGYFCFAGHVDAPVHNGLPDMWKSAITDLNDYLGLFEDAREGTLIGEATPEYLLLPAATIERMQSTYGPAALGELKFISILRNPVDRMWSHYWMMLRDGYENLSFHEATQPEVISQRLESGWHPGYDYIGYGRYGAQLMAYRQVFRPDQIKAILYEDFSRDPLEVCREVFAFLGVVPDYQPDVHVRYNFSGALRHPRLHRFLFARESVFKSLARRLVPYERLQVIKSRLQRWNCQKVPMPHAERRRLAALYRDDVGLLSDILGRDMSHWLSQG